MGKFYQGNLIFDRFQTKVNVRDNVFDKYHTLHDEFKKYGYDLSTDDINPINTSDIVLYVDMPKKLPLMKDIHKSYLIMNESPLVREDNFNIKNHKYFNKIFSWNDELVDNKKYFKFNYSFQIPKEIPKIFNKEKLCCLIVGNKDSKHPNELYSERKKLIRWFENNYPKDFDLYGVGWNEYRFKGIKLIRGLNRIPFLKKLMFKYFGDYYPSYKGKVVNKFETMQDYKFAICYENIKDIPGYITEKIFDAMFAGCVPIYWGANNVTDAIPKECFIDRRDFDTCENMYNYMKNMDEKTYMKYLSNIEVFFNSSKADPFRIEVFARSIVNEVIDDQ